MKKLVITPKGIGMAEMPIYTDWFIGDFESAKDKAISEALYFEDQERVMDWLINHIFGEKEDGAYYSIQLGTYPIPPDFPEVVERIQTRKKGSQTWIDGWPLNVDEHTPTSRRWGLRSG
jgi:hypothetical protein